MSKDFFNINIALEYLDIGVIIKDFKANYFKKSNEFILVKGNNARYKLSIKEFKELFSKEKFFIDEDSDSIIDSLKDEEYYSFKHK